MARYSKTHQAAKLRSASAKCGIKPTLEFNSEKVLGKFKGLGTNNTSTIT